MATKYLMWVRFGWPLVGVTLSIATYAAVFYHDAKTVFAYAKPNSKTIQTIHQQMNAVQKQIAQTQNNLQQLGLEYQGLLGAARRDQALIGEVNSQLSAAGLPGVPNVPTSFPIVQGYATNSSPPVFQTMTGAS